MYLTPALTEISHSLQGVELGTHTLDIDRVQLNQPPPKTFILSILQKATRFPDGTVGFRQKSLKMPQDACTLLLTIQVAISSYNPIFLYVWKIFFWTMLPTKLQRDAVAPCLTYFATLPTAQYPEYGGAYDLNLRGSARIQWPVTQPKHCHVTKGVMSWSI